MSGKIVKILSCGKYYIGAKMTISKDVGYADRDWNMCYKGEGYVVVKKMVYGA
jgi:hypothetical protein